MSAQQLTMATAEEERANQAPICEENDGELFGIKQSTAPASSSSSSSSSVASSSLQVKPEEKASGTRTAGNETNGKVGGGRPLTNTNQHRPQNASHHHPSKSASAASHPSSNATTHHAGSKSMSGGASPSSSSSPLPSAHLPYHHSPSVFHSNHQYLASNASPSQLDGLTRTEEALLRGHTCAFMSAMGMKLKLGQLAIATASVFVQVFFTHYSFKAVDRLELALTCLFLAGKVEERRTHIDYVLGAYFHEKEEFDRKMANAAGEGESFVPRPHPLQDSPEWDQLRNRVYEYEAILLDAIEYNFDVMHPYSYLRKFIEKYIYSPIYAKESDAFLARHLGGAGGLAQIAWNFINDSLRTSLCLSYSPSQICVVAIRMAMTHLIHQHVLPAEPVRSSLALPAHSNAAHLTNAAAIPPPWHEELFGLSLKQVNKITMQILEVLDLLNEKRPGVTQSILDAHLKSKAKSKVPLPCARSTQDLMSTLQQKEQMQQQRSQIQRQAHMQANQPQQPPHSSSTQQSRPPHPSSSSSNPPPPSHQPDRKRPRSPDRDRTHRNDDSRSQHHQQRPNYSPLPHPPSPFLDQEARGPWLPDLRPNRPSHQSSREPRDRDRHDSRRRSRSRSRRSRSHSRSRSRNASLTQPNNSTVTTNSTNTKPAPALSPLEDGEIRESTMQVDETMHVSSSSSMSMSSTSRLAGSTSLTKSSSTLALSSLHSGSVAHPHHAPHHHHSNSSSSSVSRIHSSHSMSNLSSSVPPRTDILAGDILRMSSCNSPTDPLLVVAEKSEEDIMASIKREANSLNQEKREEHHSPSDINGERAAKRARLNASNRSPSNTKPDEFEPSTSSPLIHHGNAIPASSSSSLMHSSPHTATISRALLRSPRLPQEESKEDIGTRMEEQSQEAMQIKIEIEEHKSAGQMIEAQ